MTDLRAVAIACLLALVAGFGSGWYFQGLRWDADVAKLGREAATARADAAQAQSEAVDKLNADLVKSRADTEVIRKTFIDYKAGSANEISDLQRNLDAGTVRLRIKAACPAPSGGNLPGPGANASGAKPADPELDAASRQDYLQLRAGLAEQYGLLTFCQAELKKRSAK